MSTIYKPNTMGSSAIKKMQNALINKGYNVGSSGADGVWGKSTAAALSSYKKNTGGSNSYGYTVGNETFNKLYGTPKKSSAGTNKGNPIASGYGTVQGFANALNQNPALLQQGMIYAQMQQQQQQYEQQLQQMQAQFDNALSMLEQQYAQNQQASIERAQQVVNSIKGNEVTIDKAYQDAQRQAYINQALEKNQMDDYLAANGFTGGMAESTLAQLNSNYENNRQSATSERDSALRQNDQLIAQAQASGNSELADLANNYTNNAIAAMQNQAQMKYQLIQAQQAQANTDREFQLALLQQQLSQKQYEDSLKADRAEQDFKTFLDTYKGKYNKRDTYQNWIDNLRKQDDPYGYNRQKIAYLQQYMNSKLKPAVRSTSVGASTGTAYAPTEAAKNAIEKITKNFHPGITPAQITNAVWNYVQAGKANKTLTDADAEYIYSQFAK